jgi:nucleotide-binding universal stress UspA family protein
MTAGRRPASATDHEGAGLLVLGCGGHAGPTEALLGSVSQFCVHHAPCRVVIMRGKHQA